MSYKVEVNRLTGLRRLVYVATVRRRVIGKKGAYNRRILKTLPNGATYHATKGWRFVRGG